MTDEPIPQPKRKVNYNQNVVLCQVCKKRIRLNNDGKLRVHVEGKTGSEKCKGGNEFPLLPEHIAKSVEDFLKEPSTGVIYDRQKRERSLSPNLNPFSDSQ